MARAALTKPFPWALYSRKLARHIDTPRFAGTIAHDPSADRLVRLTTGRGGDVALGNAVILYWLVDELDGVIADAKFQVFGQSALIGAADTACELLLGKTISQAARLSHDLIDRHLRDKPDVPAFPKETLAHLNLVLDAIFDAAASCSDIAPDAPYISPTPLDFGESLPGGYPGFDTLSKREQLSLIESTLDEHIRPFIELDDGGIELIDLIQNRELIIAYKGSCTTCHSSTGATLNAIQQGLRAKVHPDLLVTPHLDSLDLNYGEVP